MPLIERSSQKANLALTDGDFHIVCSILRIDGSPGGKVKGVCLCEMPDDSGILRGVRAVVNGLDFSAQSSSSSRSPSRSLHRWVREREASPVRSPTNPVQPDRQPLPSNPYGSQPLGIHCNKIPSALINNIGQAMMNLYPTPNANNAANVPGGLPGFAPQNAFELISASSITLATLPSAKRTSSHQR